MGEKVKVLIENYGGSKEFVIDGKRYRVLKYQYHQISTIGDTMSRIPDRVFEYDIEELEDTNEY